MISNGQLKLPSPPQGGGQMEMWARLLTDYLRQTMIRGVTGGKLKPDANFGKHLEISFPPFPIQPVQPDGMFPFKIYKPSLTFQTLGNNIPFGVIFTPNTGAPTKCTLDPTQPTNLVGANPNCNPQTDGWRIWAVRSGIVQYKAPYSMGIPETGFGFENLFDIFDVNTTFGTGAPGGGFLHGTDGIGGYKTYTGWPSWAGLAPVDIGYDSPRTTIFPANTETGGPGGCPIIIDALADFGNIPGIGGFPLWLQIHNESNRATTSAWFSVRGSSDGYFGGASGQGDDTVIPIGIIVNPAIFNAFVWQIAFGHQTNFSTSQAFTTAAIQPFWANGQLEYCGDWQNDAVGNYNIQDRAFTPGQCVSFTLSGQSVGGNVDGGGGGTFTLNYKLRSMYMCMVAGFTSDPSSDSNWLQINQGLISPFFS